MLLFYLFIFITGLAIGSFLNVVIYRMENGEDIVRDRSHCMDCKHNLAWYDLVPVFSFLILGGKCRYCGKKISMQYPLVELITGVLFVVAFGFWNLGFDWVLDFGIWDLIKLSYFLFLISSLIVIFVYDLKHYIIPDKIVYTAIIISIVYLLLGFLNFSNWDLFRISDFGFRIFSPFVAAFLAAGFFLAIVLLTNGRGMGGGDVKLAFLMGLVLGWPKILLALFLAFTLGAVCGIILMILKKKNFKSEIPFGPFLVIGTLVAMFWGEKVVKWYGNYLF